MKEFITNEIIENTSFDFKSRNVIDVILDKIEEFIDESKWNKMIKLNREFNSFKQAEEENAEEYLLRFNNLETQLKNARVNINDMFLAANLLNKSSFGQHEKENIMANIDMDDEKTILKDIKRKIRRLKAMKEKNDDPKVSLYGNYGRDERSRSFNRSRSRQQESRNSSQDEEVRGLASKIEEVEAEATPGVMVERTHLVEDTMIEAEVNLLEDITTGDQKKMLNTLINVIKSKWMKQNQFLKMVWRTLVL